ncbi:phage tail protein [Celerinatantimonas sp. MCCC 1A17872]|uniref:phage tail protein n=1 Tax=Celerinatantimonas sp. MCCC 1A17872 TaxID=3177514 RepID=UPI0038C247B7
MSQYFAILTTIGEAKIANATALDQAVEIKQMALGDGNGDTPTPSESQTALLNEHYRASLNSLSVSDDNPSQIIAELVVPEDEGGYWIRELGLFDTNGDMLAIANCPPTYKPLLSEGSGRVQRIRMVLTVSNTSAVTLKIDPSVVLATRDYVDAQMLSVQQYSDTQNSDLKAYVDSQDSDIKAYVDAQDKSYQTAAKSDATKKANQALADAQTYADTQDASTLENAKSYADTQDAATLAAAKSDATSKANSALSSAKSYADTQDATVLASAKADASSKADAAEAAAKSYSEDAGNLKTGQVDSDRLPAATTSVAGAVKRAKDADALSGTGEAIPGVNQVAEMMSQFGLFGDGVDTGLMIDSTTPLSVIDAIPNGFIYFNTTLLSSDPTESLNFKGVKVPYGSYDYAIICAGGKAGERIAGTYHRGTNEWIQNYTTSNLPVYPFNASSTRKIYTVGVDRVFGTTYTVTGEKPRLVHLIFGNSNNTGLLTVEINGTAFVNAITASQGSGLWDFYDGTFLFLPGETYMFDFTGNSMNGGYHWMEIE